MNTRSINIGYSHCTFVQSQAVFTTGSGRAIRAEVTSPANGGGVVAEASIQGFQIGFHSCDAQLEGKSMEPWALAISTTIRNKAPKFLRHQAANSKDAKSHRELK